MYYLRFWRVNLERAMLLSGFFIQELVFLPLEKEIGYWYKVHQAQVQVISILHPIH